MRLIACPECHTQYDVTDVVEATVRCRCGAEVENRELETVEARIYRCGSCSAQISSSATDCEYCGSQIIRDDGKLSLICPECFGRNSQDARFCAACGVTFSPQRVEVEGVELPCPCCGCLMSVRELIGIGINECPECNGIWVPGTKIKVLINRAIEAREQAKDSADEPASPRVKGANPSQQRVQYRKCPVCESSMARRNFNKTSGIIIDRCHEHGTWLDADELEEIAGFILSGGRPRAEEAMRRQAEHDAKQRAAISTYGSEPSSSTENIAVNNHKEAGLLNLLFELLR